MLYSLLTKAAILGVGILSVVFLGWPASDTPGPLKRKFIQPGIATAEGESRFEGKFLFEVSRIDLNKGKIADFERLPGIGAVLAKRIVDHREVHGHFNTVAGLEAVSGIGEGKMARLRPLVTVNQNEQNKKLSEANLTASPKGF